MKIVVAGSRGIDKLEIIETYLEKFLQENSIKKDSIQIVSGAARGVDQLGEAWALKNKVLVKKFPADWDRFGISAGMRRNGEMAIYGDILVAFSLNESKGTADMISKMIGKRKPAKVFKFSKEMDVDKLFRVITYCGQLEFNMEKLSDLLHNEQRS